jgi:hypothetical protein
VIEGYSAHRPNSVTAGLAIHLIVYCAVGACLAFALYALLQPSRAPNSGLAAYKPPPGTVLTYGNSFRANGVSDPIAPVAVIETELKPEPTTTGKSAPKPEQLKPTATAPSQPHTAKRPNRQVRVETPKRRIVACIPGYDSSGAQTRPCG